MSKKYLLELTQKEIDTLMNGLIKEKSSWEDKSTEEVSRTIREDKLTICNSLWATLDGATAPQSDHKISIQDLYFIVSQAKSEFVRLPADLHISRKRVEESDLKHISLAKAVIGWLNSKQLLKKIADFDITDHSYEYEESE